MGGAWIASISPVLRGLAIAGLLALAGCGEVDLYSGLDEREANSMVAVLQQNGIEAQRQAGADGSLTVRVNEERFAEAVDLLNDAGLPRQSFASMGDVFQRNGLVATPVQERAQMLFALSEELSRTVSEIDGVLSARVHIVLPDNDPLRRDVAPSSASVFIRYEAEMEAAPLVPQIKTLVANGISGLSYDNVSVVSVAAPAAAPRSVASGPRVVTVLGVSMLESSSGRALWIVGLLLSLSGALAAALIATLLRRRRASSYELVPFQ